MYGTRSVSKELDHDFLELMWHFHSAHFVSLNFLFLFVFIFYFFSVLAFVAKLFLREECLFAIENASKKSDEQHNTINLLNGVSQEAGSLVRENDRGTFLV